MDVRWMLDGWLDDGRWMEDGSMRVWTDGCVVEWFVGWMFDGGMDA